MKFNSTVFIVPGLGDSDEKHWQSLWERKYGFMRVHQTNWNTPNCDEWVRIIDRTVMQYDPNKIILVAHSLGCVAVAFWTQKLQRKVKGALLVAPSDTEAETYPKGTTGFTPIPISKLPFKSIIVASSDDPLLKFERAAYFAYCWGGTLMNIGKAGHINTDSGYGEWNEGVEILKQLDT